MIERISKLPQFCVKSLSFARIEALYNTYNDSIGVDLFLQKDGETVTAFFGGIDGTYSLCVSENADFRELEAYFSFLGATVFVDSECFEKFKPNKIAISSIYEFFGEDIKLDEQDYKISDIYKYLQNGTDGAIDLPLFEYWYTDFCARYNKRSACYAVYEESVAVCGFMTEAMSLITGVAVPLENRKKGNGRNVVSFLTYKIHSIYPKSRILAVTSENTEGFYLKLGFKEIGKCAVCEF